MTNPHQRSDALRRWPVRALRVLLAVGFGLVCAELGLRFAVLTDASAGWALAYRLGLPAAFGSPRDDNAYWEVSFLGQPPAAQLDHPDFDPYLGWTSYSPVGPDNAHPGESTLDGRRPLLLFGDSFGLGVPGATSGDFESQFDASTLSREFALLNFASGGYGLDQILLSLRRSVERLEAQRPVVVASLYVDDDIDRCVLSFRCWPKPRLRVVDAQLQPDQPRVPRVEEYFASHASLSGSLVKTVLAKGVSRWAGRGQPRAADAEKRELGRAILTEMVSELRSRNVEFLFVLFVGCNAVEQQLPGDWRETLVVETLESLDAPWLCVRPALVAHAALTDRKVTEYFLPDDHPGRGHLNGLGNAVVFQAMQEGLAQHLEVGPGGDVRLLPQDFRVVTQPPGLGVPRWRAESAWLEGQCGPGPYIVHSTRAGQRFRFSWRLQGAARGLRLWATAPLAASGAGSRPVVRVLADGLELQSIGLTPGAAPELLDFDVTGVNHFELEIERADQQDSTQGVVLSAMTIVGAGLPRQPPPIR